MSVMSPKNFSFLWIYSNLYDITEEFYITQRKDYFLDYIFIQVEIELSPTMPPCQKQNSYDNNLIAVILQSSLLQDI